LFVKFSKFVTNELEGIEQDQSFELDLKNDFPGVIDYLKKLEKSYLLQIQGLIDCIQVLGVAETVRLGSLVTQLDYNNYYSKLTPTTDFIFNPIVPISR
jgi:hypothetical protein